MKSDRLRRGEREIPVLSPDELGGALPLGSGALHVRDPGARRLHLIALRTPHATHNAIT